MGTHDLFPEVCANKTEGRRSTLLEHNWEGRGDVPNERLYTATGNDVHRFKLEEEHRFIITTHRNGGLRVTGMEDDTLLFELPVVSKSHSNRIAFDSDSLGLCTSLRALRIRQRIPYLRSPTPTLSGSLETRVFRLGW